jgi:hypothetical protein
MFKQVARTQHGIGFGSFDELDDVQHGLVHERAKLSPDFRPDALSGE